MTIHLEGPWFEINGDDYEDEALYDGTQLDAIVKVESTVTGDTLYFGLIQDVEWSDEDEDDIEFVEVTGENEDD